MYIPTAETAFIEPLALAELSLCLTMVGVIWMVQLVHYPLFAAVGSEHFQKYHARHCAIMGWFVGPLMCAEALCTIAPFFLTSLTYSRLILVSLLGIIWLSTTFIQVPLHRRLAASFDRDTHTRLVRSNWIRTTAWTARALMLIAAQPIFL